MAAPSFGSSNPNTVGGSVFGTFGVQYKPEEFERVREDGFTAIGMVPDCRVFICGAEVTKDVLDVSVNNSIDGNTCDITLTNPRGRYEITKQDLMGKWREDKDILAAYDYSQFKRVTPGLFDSFMDKITPSAFGSKTASKIKQGMSYTKLGMDAARSVLSPFAQTGGSPPKVKGVTRQMFEVKYFSGLTKHNGDVVFDYKDPVYVFFKGRFAPLWYFGFAGIVTGWDDTDVYEQSYTIKIKCEDVTALWKRAKLVLQGAMYPHSRGEDRDRSVQTGSARNPLEISATFNFSDIIKVAVFSYDFAKFTNNCHEINPGVYKTPPEKGIGADDISTTDKYKDKIRRLQQEAFIDGGIKTVGGADARYMFTRSEGGWGIAGNGKATKSSSTNQKGESVPGGSTDTSYNKGDVNTSNNAGLVPISKISYLYKDTFKGMETYKLNESPLGPSAPIYMQLNEIEFPENVPFNGKNLKAYLDVSIRYWEAEHSIPDKVSDNVDEITGTGWKDGKAYGVAGIHPALTHEFIDNFNILDGIWQQCYTNKENLDKVIMTPNDKIRSTVAGMPTELVADGDLADSKKKPIGTAFNFFRPRLFVILPRRFSDRQKKGEGGFAKFENLFKQSTTSVFEFLKEKLKGVEYIMYASPCGDVFIEPELYDFHPLEFSQKVEQKSIITKEIPVTVKTYSGEKDLPATRQDKAYMYNPLANHPFFIMEKDRIRTSQTFNHQLIHTEITVRGGITKMGGITEIFDDQTREAVTAIATGRQSRGYTMDTMFSHGSYVANGFQKRYDPNSSVSQARSLSVNQKAILDKMAFTELLKNYADLTILQAAKQYGTFMLKKDRTEKQNSFYYIFINESKSVRNLLESGTLLKEGDTLTKDDDANYLLQNQFPKLSINADKKIKEVLNYTYGKLSVKSDKDYRNTVKKSIVMDKLKVSTDVYEIITNVITSSSYDPKDESFAAVREMIRLGLCTGSPTLVETEKVKEVAKKLNGYIIDYNAKGGGDEGILIRNIAEEKTAAKNGIYDPRTDMVKQYGFNPKEPIKNPYIQSGIEAYEYARTVFNRLKGKAFQIQMEVIGRPEFLLNRPYYCERKDAIGLLTKYSVRFQIGSSFLSSATLDYIRKNAIVFSYDLGELDPFPEGKTGNAAFQKQAENYYKLNKFTNNFASKTTNAIVDVAGGENPGFGRALGAKLVGNVASSVMESVLPVGGVFSLHDRIGHIPFDTRFGEKGLTTSKISAESIYGTSKIIEINNYEILHSISMQITDKLKAINTSDTEIKGLTTAITNGNKALTQDKKTLAEKNKKLKDTKLKPDERAKLTKERNILNDKIKNDTTSVETNTTKKENAERAKTDATIELYGISPKPSNLTNTIIGTFRFVISEGQKAFPRAAEYSQGLFYKLFEQHLDGMGGLPDDWTVTDEKPVKREFPGLTDGTIEYYIILKDTTPKPKPTNKKAAADKGSADAKNKAKTQNPNNQNTNTKNVPMKNSK